MCRPGLLIGREGFARGSGSPKRDGRGAAPVVPEFKHRGSVISHSIEDIGRDLGETICRLPRLLHGRAREARCSQVRSAGAHGCQGPEDRRLVSRHASMITPCERQSIAPGRSASPRVPRRGLGGGWKVGYCRNLVGRDLHRSCQKVGFANSEVACTAAGRRERTALPDARFTIRNMPDVARTC